MHACVPGDACLDAGCSHECLSARGGGAFCLCPSGMQLGADWKTCEGKLSYVVNHHLSIFELFVSQILTNVIQKMYERCVNLAV